MTHPDATATELGMRVSEALQEQVELQIEVAREEVLRDVRSVARNLAPLVLAAGMVGLGSVFLLVGLALALAPWLGPAPSVLLVGAVQVVGASVGVRVLLARPESRWMLPTSRAGGPRAG